MNHEGQLQLYGPLDLRFESLQLLLLKVATPLVVETHLADGDGKSLTLRPLQMERGLQKLVDSI